MLSGPSAVMAGNPLQETRPVFLAVYAAVLVGIVFSSAVYILSSARATRPSVYSVSIDLQSTNTDQGPSSSQISSANVTSGPSDAGFRVPAPPSGSYNIWTRPIWDVPPTGSKMPPMKDFRLTKVMVGHRAKDNVIIVTFGNYAFMDFIVNWVKHLTDLGVFNLLVGAMDTKLLESLYWKGVPVFDMGSNMDTVDVGWGSRTFHKMGREKVILIDAILPFGYELLMCDTDMVWLKNPLPYFARFPEADILTSTDQVIPTVTDDRLDIWQQVSGSYNIGIFHWRPTNSSKKMVRQWKEMLLADEHIWDQTGFNDIMHRNLGPSVDDESGLVYSFDGNLKLGLLPASIFCSGHTYFVQAMHQQLRLEPYAVHTTFQFAGTEGKRHRLREGMVFYDEPEYYDSPGGFLSFNPSIPKSLFLDGEHTVESHFSLINYQCFIPESGHENTTIALQQHNINAMAVKKCIQCTVGPNMKLLWSRNQLSLLIKCSIVADKPPSHSPQCPSVMKQIRTALAVASLLNRTLVMPPLWCRLDRLWFAHPGVLQGTMTRQPFLCPLDHVFEVNVMLKDLPALIYGPGIDIREYSFLENPLLPKLVKESLLEVQLCDERFPNCHITNKTNQAHILRFPKHSSEEMFTTIFSSFKDVKVIRFSSMEDAFQGFTDKTKEAKFRNRMKLYAGIWCCVEDHVPGHIYYDIYWDEKPGWKPIPPATSVEDRRPE